MPSPIRRAKRILPTPAARAAVAVTLLLPLTGACDRLMGTNAEKLALAQQQFDSLAALDSTKAPRTAADDSLFAIQEVQRRTDSILRLTRPELGPPPGAEAGAEPAAPAPTPPLPSTTGRAAAAAAAAQNAGLPSAPGRAPNTVPINPSVTTDVQRRLNRAQLLGDSIANAKVGQMVGQNRATTVTDSVRGVVKLSGSVPGTRPVLVANGTTVTLTGIGVEGLETLDGADVVVNGLRVSPRDIVVSNFNVRAVKGITVLDGRLMRDGKNWSLELSDKSGIRKLAAIPELLKAAVGARVWIDAANTARPGTYGIIARR